MFRHLSTNQQEILLSQLAQHVTAEKLARITAVLAQRTRTLAVMLENIVDPHNAGAALRSCDGFGVQDMHIVDDQQTFEPATASTTGSFKWISRYIYQSQTGKTATSDCLMALKAQGYHIVATTLRGDSIPIQQFTLQQKTVVCFGNEEHGLSDTAHALADTFVHVPMVGFAQSYNISVTVAMCLFVLRQKLLASELSWHLTKTEKTMIQLEWLQQLLPNGDILVRHYLGQS